MSPVSGDLYERSWVQERRTISFVNLVCRSSFHHPGPRGPGQVVVKLAGGKTHRVARREVSLPYTFGGFSDDDFLVTAINYAFDCIMNMSWLARYKPQIDWLARSVRRRRKFTVSEVFTHLLTCPSD